MEVVSSGLDFLTNLDLNLSGTVARLLLALLAGFPFAVLHRVLLRNELQRHLASIICGLGLLYWVFGESAIHPLISFAFTYFAVTLLPPKISVILVFLESVLHLNYLYWLYYTTDFGSTLDADVSGPQCIVLCKCVSFAFDHYDGWRLRMALSGTKDPATDRPILSTDQMARQLSRLPSPIEYAGYCLFPIGLMVGPYFTFRHYLTFTNRSLYLGTNTIPPTTRIFIDKLLWCAFHALVFHFVGELLPITYVFEQDFIDQPWWYKIVYMSASFRVHLFKYVILWFLVEASGILAGIGMSGYDDKMQPKWDAFQNIQPLRLMFSYNYGMIVRAWHCKANDFLVNYIFKRIPGRNRPLNLLISMLFLGSWHGLYVGYFVTFGFEFFLLFAEETINAVIQRVFPGAPATVPAPLRFIGFAIFWVLAITSWSTALTPFFFLTWERFYPIWISINHAGVLGCVLTIVVGRCLLMVLPRPKRKDDGAAKTHKAH